MVPNALAAAAVGRILGVPIEASAEALGAAAVSRWRMETFATPEGVRVINDAYNANPESMAAALKSARMMAADDRLIAVLGHGRDRPDRRRGARARGRPRGAAAGRPARDGRARCQADRDVRAPRGRGARDVASYDDLGRRSPTCGCTHGPVTSCCSRARASRGSRPSRRRCGDLDPGGWGDRPDGDAARDPDRDQGLHGLGMGPAHPRRRSPHAHGEDGNTDDGRHRDPRRPAARLPRGGSRPGSRTGP